MYLLFAYLTDSDRAASPFDPNDNPFMWHVIDDGEDGVGCMTACGIPLYTVVVMTVDSAFPSRGMKYTQVGEPGCAECFSAYGLAFLQGIKKRLDFTVPEPPEA